MLGAYSLESPHKDRRTGLCVCVCACVGGCVCLCGDYSSHVQTKEKDGEGEKSKLGGSEMERREDRDRAIDRNKGGVQEQREPLR